MTKTAAGNFLSPMTTLAHELLGHGFANDQGTNNDKGLTSYGLKNSELKAVQIENRANKAFGYPQETKYGNIPIPEKDRILKK